jgi:NCAIR mutase (PurE)-related protein
MEDLKRLLEAVAAGQVTPDQAMHTLKDSGFFAVEGFAKVDWQRERRTGVPEVIWGQGKTPEQIAAIALAMRDRGASVIMATRVDRAAYDCIAEIMPDLYYHPLARICSWQSPEALRRQPRPGTIALVSAGTADLPVAEEAAITAELMGCRVDRLWDVGIAGIHRLFAHRDQLSRADVLIVVAGMEGALPSVVAGLVDVPVVAVPTSVGYGASFDGLAPLLTMLNSCAAGVGVVNIDNGFGAAILAGQILRTAARIPTTSRD